MRTAEINAKETIGTGWKKDETAKPKEATRVRSGSGGGGWGRGRAVLSWELQTWHQGFVF